MTQTNIYTDTFLDSGKNLLIHIIDEVSTAITVKLQRHLHHHHEKKKQRITSVDCRKHCLTSGDKR